MAAFGKAGVVTGKGRELVFSPFWLPISPLVFSHIAGRRGQKVLLFKELLSALATFNSMESFKQNGVERAGFPFFFFCKVVLDRKVTKGR